MALGGGTFTVQNKVLPGAYMNFVSAARADAALSERGIAAVPMILPWGPEQTVITITAEEFYQNALKLFGCNAYSAELLPLREIFAGARSAVLMRVNKGGAMAASSLAVAAYTGTMGNNLRVTVEAGTADGTFDVTTWLRETAVDKQEGVETAGELAKNGFVTFNKSLPLKAGEVYTLTGGKDGTAQDEDYEAFLNKIESYSFHTLGLPSDQDTLKKMFAEFTRRMRENTGVKIQCVLFRYEEADYEGVISVENSGEPQQDMSGSSGGNGSDLYTLYGGDASLVYWVTGASAGCAPGRSLTNTVYGGELEVDCDYTAARLEEALKNGSFVLHRVGKSVRVLEDINTLTGYSGEKSRDFADNQTVRLIDQIGTDIAALFNERYLGKTPNDAAGRVALWSDIVAHHRQLELLGAIEEFSPEDVKVEQGDTKKAVVVRDCITPTGAMTRLYMTVVIQ